MVLLSSAHGFVVVLVLRLMVLWLYCTHGAFTATLYTQFQLYGCMIILYSWFSAMLYSWFYSCVIYSRFDGNVILIDAKVYKGILCYTDGFMVSLHSWFYCQFTLAVSWLCCTRGFSAMVLRLCYTHGFSVPVEL